MGIQIMPDIFADSAWIKVLETKLFQWTAHKSAGKSEMPAYNLLILHAKRTVVSCDEDLCRIIRGQKSSKQFTCKAPDDRIVSFNAAKTVIPMQISTEKDHRDLFMGKFFQKTGRAILVYGDGDQSLDLIRILCKYFFQHQPVAVAGEGICVF